MNTLSGACAGNHTVLIEDANGCAAYDTITLSEPPELIATVPQDSVSCFGGCDGSASITVSGGSSPYNYVWDSIPIQNNDSITSLCMGSHNVLVTDNNGCTLNTSFFIDQPAPLSITLNASPPTCYSSCDGSLTVAATGGNGTYSYLWSTLETTASINTLCAGSYRVSVTDQKGCADSISTILDAPVISPVAGNDTTICVDCTAGLIKI